MPYFVMDIFSSMPGVPGLFVACAFSGTLSTVAASINALATVTFEDLVKKGFPNLSEKMSTWISKGLCRPLLADTWYSLSYLYFSAIGCLGCAIIGLLISFLTDTPIVALSGHRELELTKKSYEHGERTKEPKI
ncbi:sodium-coupled hypothetical protein [Limosa lapponica baueri]|uniref:Uncharacterized protein n=1 Tax=Limosa lapponica baueri TaxID=1758121 RepID=A0A2I0TFS0_LIMLA|nr:sodium-coupled hypothetical protein [Limosa lapponica baueri]